MDSHPGPDSGVSPVEMVAMSLAGCTAMDVISILGKIRQDVKSFDVAVHADRAVDYPKVITSARLEYVIVGHAVQESAVLTRNRSVGEKVLPRACHAKACLPDRAPL